MKAVVQHAYGSADVLHVEDVETPAPRDDEVLLRVVAASVHPGDSLLTQGVPYLMRLGTGLARPRTTVPGHDVAGIVEKVGARVRGLTVGDAVFGEGRSTLAEHACAKQDRLVIKPDGLSFAQAAVLPVSGSTALKAMRDVGRVQPGQAVLINGASGGVGVYAVQIAVALGAEVTGVCGSSNVDLVRSLGASDVIDYTVTDVTTTDRRYDVILDNVGTRTLGELRGVLAPQGTLMPNSGTAGGRWLGTLPRVGEAALVSPFVSQRVTTFFASPNPDNLAALADFVLSGAVRAVISGTYTLDKAADAMRVVASGHASGKVVVTVDRDAGEA